MFSLGVLYRFYHSIFLLSLNNFEIFYCKFLYMNKS